jgi:hypothetical protein
MRVAALYDIHGTSPPWKQSLTSCARPTSIRLLSAAMLKACCIHLRRATCWSCLPLGTEISASRGTHAAAKERRRTVQLQPTCSASG